MLTTARRAAARLADLLRSEHHAMVDFLLALADFDRSRGWAELGHASLWYFLHRQLGLSAGAAQHRKVAAGLVRRFPEVEAALRDGRLCLSSVIELGKVLTPENAAEVLPRFFHLSAREAKEVVAALLPREVVPTRTVVAAARRSPARDLALQTSEVDLTSSPHGVLTAAVPPGLGTIPLQAATPATTASPPVSASAPDRDPDGGRTEAPPRPTSAPREVQAAPLPLAVEVPASTVEPLTADLRRLHLTVSGRFLQKLKAARAARSHARPGATDEALLEEALDLLLAREARRREAATSRPLAEARPAAPDLVPAHVRREVWARDGGCCQWPVDSGGVCGSTHQVELDHEVLRCRGGPPKVANLRLLCKAHNLESERRALGEGWMRRFVRRKAERSGAPRRASPRGDQDAEGGGG
jgi:5-methylcytosine-specific restriction endonuclease McrA